MFLPKTGRRKADPAYLGFIATLPCVAHFARGGVFLFGVQVAHIRYGDLAQGKPGYGMGDRPHDRWTVPLCHVCHAQQHAMNERAWWEALHVDPIRLAASLHDGDRTTEAGIAAIISACAA